MNRMIPGVTTRCGVIVTSPLSRLSYRYISDTIKFTVPNQQSTDQNNMKKIGKLRIPLMKSPSHFGHFSSRMNRLYNEDKYSAAVLSLADNRTVFNFNVFDGHGGAQCSTFLSENLAKDIESSNKFGNPQDDITKDELLKLYVNNIGGYWRRWFKRRDTHYANLLDEAHKIKLSNLDYKEDDFRLRLLFSFLRTDYEFFSQEDNKSGSTCTSVLLETIYSESENLRPTYEHYYFNLKTISRLTIAHVGDSSAIIADKNGEAHILTQPHHPSNPEEASRLRKLSANLFMTDSFGEERFISLANTRAFGDVGFKGMGVTAEPDVTQYIIGDSAIISKKLTSEESHHNTIGGLGGDERFLVLCSDGVTDVLTGQEIVDIVMSHYNLNGQNQATPQSAAEEVIKFVEYVGGDDNATCLVIRLNGWGHWPVIDRTGELRQTRMDDFNPRSQRV